MGWCQRSSPRFRWFHVSQCGLHLEGRRRGVIIFLIEAVRLYRDACCLNREVGRRRVHRRERRWPGGAPAQAHEREAASEVVDRNRHQPSEREQRPESGPHFIKNACRSLANQARSALLPRDTAQLIRLDNAADLVAIRDWNVKAPIAIAPRNRAGHAPIRQVIEGAWREH